MDFQEIVNKVKELNFSEMRADEAGRFEAVIVKQAMGELKRRLEEYFGQPIFPSGQKLTAEIQRSIDSNGGIMPGQTLYYRSQGKEVLFAMLWPWSDGQHITIKIIQE